MSENVRIAVRDSLDRQILTFLDNTADNALHYTNDTLNRFVEGDASVLTLDVAKTEDDVQYLVCGNKLAFIWKKKEYWLNIIDVEENEYTMTVIAFSLSLELNNETRGEYSSDGAMSIEQYIRKFDSERTLTIGLNEVSDKKISYEWTGTQTVLARLYSIANVFSAEFEFVTKLNDDYSLNSITLNIYRKHSDDSQGIGEDKTNVTLRFGKEINTITRKENIKEIYTGIRPRGKDGLTLAGYSRKEFDSNGLIEYYTDGDLIRAPQARDRFPSFAARTTDMYITYDWDTEYSTQEALYGAALAELKKHCVPELEFEVSGYFDTNVGDTLTIENNMYKPILIIEARVTEQIESFTDPSKNKTTFSNFKEIGSQIDSSLLAKVQQLIDANKTYDFQLLTDGIIFKNGTGQTTLTARVMDKMKDVTAGFKIVWYVDGEQVAESKTSYTVTAGSLLNETAVVSYTAFNFDINETEAGRAEVTVADVYDGPVGEPGENGKDGEDGQTSYIHIAYANSDDGTIDFSLTDPNREYIGVYSDFEVSAGTDPTLYSWSKVLGPTGADGKDGKTGIPYLQPNAPTGTIQDGSTWYQTISETNKDVLKIFNYVDGQWVESKMTAGVFNVQELSALSANLGTVLAGTLNGTEIINPFDVVSQGARIVGETKISGAKIRMEYTVPEANQSGFMEINPQGTVSTIYDSAGGIVSTFSVDSTGILIRQGSVSSTLSAETLYDTGWVDITATTSGFTGKVYARRYMGRCIIRLDDVRLSATGYLGAIPSSVWTMSQQMMISFQAWVTSSSPVIIQIGATGNILKNTTTTQPLSGFFEVF
ncbi:phage tail protein [uncultured Enterococcus sp.]|uniref:phage tail protein n=1 Tax=uncultured Enterococcus sp. TaxID=167972 RepID=UPI002AA791EF|nr:phage tail protein [uncultured Enterococcus sp.]